MMAITAIGTFRSSNVQASSSTEINLSRRMHRRFYWICEARSPGKPNVEQTSRHVVRPVIIYRGLPLSRLLIINACVNYCDVLTAETHEMRLLHMIRNCHSRSRMSFPESINGRTRTPSTMAMKNCWLALATGIKHAVHRTAVGYFAISKISINLSRSVKSCIHSCAASISRS